MVQGVRRVRNGSHESECRLEAFELVALEQGFALILVLDGPSGCLERLQLLARSDGVAHGFLNSAHDSQTGAHSL